MTLFRNIASTYAARIATIVATLVLLPVSIHFVGVEAYGLYSATVATSVLFSLDLGMGAATTKFAAEYASRRELSELRTLSSVTCVTFAAIGIISSGLFALAMLFLLPAMAIPSALQDAARALAILGALNLLISLGLASHRQLLAGVGRLDLANLVQVTQALIRIVLTVVVLWTGAGVVAIGIVDTAAALACGVLAWVLRRRLAPDTIARPRHFTLPMLKRLTGLSAAVFVFTFAGAMILQSGTIIAGVALTLQAAAVYTTANRAFLLVREVTNSLTPALLPHSSAKAATGDHGSLKNLYVDGTAVTNMLIIWAVVPLFIFAGPALAWWAGPEMAAASAATQVLLVSMLLNNNHLIAAPMLIARGTIWKYSILHTVWALSGCALAYVFGSALGTVGIALGLTAPLVVLEPIYIAIALRELDVRATIFLWRSVLKPYMAALVPAGAMLFLSTVVPPNTWVLIAMSAVWTLVVLPVFWLLAPTSAKRALRAATSRLYRRSR